ncbi:Succinate dehydrogenase assembly factor 4 [Spatholobus suberectus]|nr:Succinate dehydrogenase assembly factor 4 [Spatholobus suberectus]
MTTSFPRSLSRVAHTAVQHTRSEQLTRFVSNSVTRLLCSSSTQPQHENPVREQAQAPQESLHDESKQSHEPKENDEDGDSINKETGEVGGPKGPEPTRYGDWERNWSML